VDLFSDKYIECFIFFFFLENEFDSKTKLTIIISYVLIEIAEIASDNGWSNL